MKIEGFGTGNGVAWRSLVHGIAALAVVAVSAGCRRQKPDAEATSRVAQAVTGGDGGTLVPSACVVSLGALSIGANDTVQGGIAGTSLNLSPSVKVTGNAYSSGNVTVGNQVTITGALDYAGTLSQGSADSYGSVQHTSVAAPTLSTQSFTAGTTTINIPGGGSQTISPGSYGSVTIGSGAHATFGAGTYTMASLTVDGGAVVTFNTASGEIDLRVSGNVSWDSSTINAADPSKVGLYSNGTTVSLASGLQFAGSITAPSAAVTLGSGSAVIQGCVAGKSVTIPAGTSIMGSTNPCASAANGAACNDGNACTQTDTCQSGVCTGSNPVTCTASDACHVAGTCNASTGVCSNPTAANGAACNDGNACTQTDSCQSGVCTGSNPVTCTASDACHAAGTCDPASGTCSNPAAADGTTCNDGNACTQTDSCQSGVCTGSNPVTCTASDACHAAGTCDPASGTCSNPAASDGTSCNDGNACTQVDACLGGVCTGASPVVCVASDQCHTAGACDPSTGACSNPIASNGTTCNDGNACTQTDSCQNGTCTGSNPVTCTASDQCHTAGTCNPANGTCSNPVASNGTACNDGNGCTQTDACQSGTCTGSNPVTCMPAGPCSVAGTCDPSSGTCSNPSASDGTACDDGNACTQNDVCTGGICAGTPGGCNDAGAPDGSTDAGVPQPVLSPTPIDPTVTTELQPATAFLYESDGGAPPVQTGVSAGTVLPTTAAVIDGHVFNSLGNGLAGVTVSALNHPELGSTLTDDSGQFFLAVNGGGSLVIDYELSGYLPAQRLIAHVPWQDYAIAGNVVLLQPDSTVTDVDLSSATGIQVARGTTQSDTSGARTATVLVPSGTQATMTMPDGTTTALGSMSVRATEYTVGESGPSAMPGDLPLSSAYTYAVELSADEAIAAGATSVTFSAPLAFYVENFLGFAVGTPVPVGSYDRSAGTWVPSTAVAPGQVASDGGTLGSGVVLQILGVESGAATVDVTGDGVADQGATLDAYGITVEELQQLASLYSPGQTLWRALIPHFSAWDLNWGDAPPDDAGAPTGANPTANDGFGPGNCNNPTGSVIGCQTGVLGEDHHVDGTPYTLHYASNRQRGRAAQLTIPLSGATVPGPALSIDLDVVIGGREFTQSFPPQANETTTFSWDGLDTFGRELQGSQPIVVRVGNEYQAVYTSVSRFAATGHLNTSGIPITQGPARDTLVLWKEWDSVLGNWDAKPLGLGGWSLDVYHSYDVAGRILYFGDGSELTPTSLLGVIQTFAHTGISGVGNSAGSMRVGPDGSVYDSALACVRQITPSLTFHTVAGQCNRPGFDGDGFSGDNGPATSAQLNSPGGIAFGPDGSLYIADTNNHRIRRVDTNGIITTVAGSGPGGIASPGGFDGDGGPATQALLGNPTGVDVGPDGTIYIADQNNRRVRRVGPDGIITTVAGNGSVGQQPVGSAVVATSSPVLPGTVRVMPDGSFIITDVNGADVRRVGTDGLMRIFAGIPGDGDLASGDGGPATSAPLGAAADLAVARDGSVYILTTKNGSTTECFLRRVDPTGIISTVAGGGSCGDYGDQGPAALAGIWFSGLAIAPDDTLYIADTFDDVIRSVAPVLGGFTNTSGFTISSRDGSQVYFFDATGRHLRTVDARTGSSIYTFSADSIGRLASVTDAYGNATTISYDAGGNPTFQPPPSFGGTTTGQLDANGYLAAITDPASQTTQFTYSADGLMQTLTDARGGLHQFAYDPSTGRLINDVDPAGGSKTLTTPSESFGSSASGFSVAVSTLHDSTTQSSYQTTYETQTSTSNTFSRLNTFPNGLQSSLSFTPSGVTTTTVPDGTQTTESDTADPCFGMLSPATSVATRTPSGLSRTDARSRAITGSCTSPTAITESTSVNGRTWTRKFTPSTLTWTATSPVGRTTTTVVNTQEQPTAITVAGVTPVQMTYDATGRLQTVTQGTFTAPGGAPDGGAVQLPRQWTYAYDANGYLASVTDPTSAATHYVNDAIGRPTDTLLPSSVGGAARDVQQQYDPDSNVTSVTLPNSPLEDHQLSYTPVDELMTYAPPDPGILTGNVSPLGPAAWETQDTYFADRQPELETRPDGSSIAYAYDASGRLSTTTIPGSTLTRSYDDTPGTSGAGHLQSIATSAGETLTFGYDGKLRTSLTWAGPVAGQVTFGYDSSFRVISQGVNASSLSFGYDNDDLLTSAGALTLVPDTLNGLSHTSSIGSIADALSPDANGLFANYTASFSGSVLYAETIGSRDGNGRITEKTETIGAATHTWQYAYDPAGRLTDVSEDGTFVSHYGYDADDNRTTFTNASGTINPTYDAQDRLLTYGDATYAYTANGELSSKTDTTGTTSYTYDALGNLLHVGLPSGTAIDYVVDGENRRVGKKVNGTLVEGFLYEDALHVVAQLDGSGNVVARYVFGSKPNVPEYFTSAAGTFRILSDHLGSPRLVVNTANGSVVEEIDYDEFGNVTNDTAPGTTSFGFAGGLYDKDTGLVRFGARDYDASTGRWTNKDPIRFAGGFNLYVYVGNDPINHTDPYGRDWYDWITVPYDLGICVFDASQYNSLVNYCTALVNQVCDCQPSSITGLGSAICSDEGASCGPTSPGCLDLGVDPVSSCLQNVGGPSALAAAVNSCGPFGLPVEPPRPVDVINRVQGMTQ